MGLLTGEVEKVIQEILPEQFGLVLDRWTEGREHFVAVFTCFPQEIKCQTLLLAFTLPL